MGAEEPEAAEAGAEELEVADLGAEELEAAGTGAEETEAAYLGTKRGAGREGADSRPLKAAPGSLEVPRMAWPCSCACLSQGKPRTFYEKGFF